MLGLYEHTPLFSLTANQRRKERYLNSIKQFEKNCLATNQTQIPSKRACCKMQVENSGRYLLVVLL
jgi:hypothetical protein